MAGPDTHLHSQPARAIRAALDRVPHARVDGPRTVEIDEAFAAVGIHSTRELGIDPAIVNVHGGRSRSGIPSARRAPASWARRPAASPRSAPIASAPRGSATGGICDRGIDGTGQGSAVILRAL
ncbi:3-ketoacyl-CoA thiolase @ Acetyl-CoA acetyltransferase [Gulosibacter sp. 10]|nr:3-ketoacyl-CoA thiolase @ Acetyl-CoA acetyltransferase [Gulosibacter sp. 10]